MAFAGRVAVFIGLIEFLLFLWRGFAVSFFDQQQWTFASMLVIAWLVISVLLAAIAWVFGGRFD